MDNFTTVFFDGLGVKFDVPSVAFSIGGYEVHWYGIIIAFGFALAVLYGGRMAYKWKMQAQYFTSDEIYVMEQALYKIATAKLLENKNISKAIRLHDSKIVEVNPTYSIVSKEGLPEDIMELYRKLKGYACLLQFVSSGVVAVTKSRREELSEFLELREEAYRLSKKNSEA